MFGTMMSDQLLLSGLLEQAAARHPDMQIVGRDLDGIVRRQTYAQTDRRVRCLANALVAHGLKSGDVAGSLAWSTRQHLELFHAIPALGAVLHTVNPRLAPDTTAYVVESANDSWMFIDAGTLAQAEALAPHVPHVQHWVYLGPDAPRTSSLPDLLSVESLIAGAGSDIEWPSFDERRAAIICFTSGTTGKPKGVVNSHRSTVLSALCMSTADMVGGYLAGAQETVMPIAPLFHGNGWQMPYFAPLNGQRIVMPGRALDADSLVQLLLDESVTIAAAVPTIWTEIVRKLDAGRLHLPALRVALVAGARVPGTLFDALERRGVSVFQSWGMTEALGACRATPPPGSASLDPTKLRALRRERQGRPNFCTRVKIVDADGLPQPHDGSVSGRLLVRGPLVTARYLGEPEADAVEWLDTGDIAKIHRDGTLEIVDRVKDVIKSGGEWISSLELEAAALTHPAIESAAAIAAHHEKWQERPLLLCKRRAAATATAEELQEHLRALLPRWWLPDAILFIEEMPMTGTGKIDKTALKKTHEFHLGGK
jgi:acyl-CoA synthetase (AMP-forming)/AMP-acid ligase II